MIIYTAIKNTIQIHLFLRLYFNRIIDSYLDLIFLFAFCIDIRGPFVNIQIARKFMLPTMFKDSEIKIYAYL